LITWHYAQVKFNEETQKYHLYKSQDHLKDQTFFLCQIDQNTLKQTLFPIGKYKKSYIRKVASEIGLDRVSNKKGSVGICFIGKRKFSDFIDQYLARQYGEIIDVESGTVIGAHRGIHHFTIGQRLNCVPTGQKPYFVAKKDVVNKIVYAACGTDHPSLYCDEFYVSQPHWISQNYENTMNDIILDSQIDFKYQQKHNESAILYMKKILNDNGEIKYLVKSKYAFRGLAPGQFSVFYSKDECIGSAKIIATPKSLFDLNYQGPIVNTDKLLSKKYL
jgi:tRNA (5-methylaminomethyl-2-thiouridylate)-methyltransferase